MGDPDVIIVDDDNINQDLILNEPAQQCEVEVVLLSSEDEEETHADEHLSYVPKTSQYVLLKVAHKLYTEYMSTRQGDNSMDQLYCPS